jgi:hypothetical protein
MTDKDKIKGQTEHKETKVIQKSEDRYRNLYDSIKEGISMTDMQGDILECNQAYADMLGYTKQELTGLTYQQLTPAKWHKMDAEFVERQVLARGYSDEYEKENINFDIVSNPEFLREYGAYRMISYGLSDPGLKRSNNEDAFLVRADLDLFVVADGMGGAAAQTTTLWPLQRHRGRRITPPSPLLNSLQRQDRLGLHIPYNLSLVITIDC